MNYAGALLLWTVAGAFASSPDDSGPRHEVVVSPYVLPGGVADPAGRHGFLANADRGVSAVDLRNGAVLWETSAACRPIVVTGERLYASVAADEGAICVVALDIAHKGQVVFRSDPLALPPTRSHRPLNIRWIPDREQLRITWQASGEPDTRGAAVVDLRSGRVQPTEDAGSATPAAFPAIVKRVVRWQGIVGNAYKAVELEETAAEQRLVLRGWDLTSGLEQAPRVLLDGKRLIVRATLNERYLCIRDAVPSPDEKSDERGRHAWSIFDIRTGDLVARLPYDRGTQAIAILGSRAYCLVAGSVPAARSQPFVNARILKAIDLDTGKLLWERPAEGKRLIPVGS
jgi:hypothetical protein